MRKSYVVDICGRKEELPVLPLPSGVGICFFNLHGNVGLTEFCAERLAEKIKKHAPDVLITAESKGLQLTHCIARDFGHKFYAAARKSKKLYMQDGIEVEAKTITTAEVQHLYLSAHDVELLRGKRVAIIDDVISTGAAAARWFAARSCLPRATQRIAPTSSISRAFRLYSIDTEWVK